MARLTLATRLVAVVALIGGVVMLVAGLILVDNARQAIAVEMAANQTLARDYVLTTIGSLRRDNSAEAVVERLPQTLFQPRHARITVIEAASGATRIPEVAPQADEEDEDEAPAWFHALLRPETQELTLPLQFDGRDYGHVAIDSEPSDEINEVWQDFRVLGLIGGTSYVLMILAVYLVVRWTLRPLAHMTEEVARMEGGDYGARIGTVRVPDLAPLARQFDALGAALQATSQEKRRLNQKLVAVQDEERKAIARELHDELGPCLFGLKVEGRSIADMARKNQQGDIAESAAAMMEIISQIQDMNDMLLRRLRPAELGELPLSRVLEALLDNMRGIGPSVAWEIAVSPELDRYSESAELTVYRVVQEAVTNALRHSGAGRIIVTVRPQAQAPGEIEISVEDDGRGIAPETRAGVGLHGMRERIDALNGTLEIDTRPEGGTRVHAIVPDLPRASQTGAG
ncbi:ATP-binding protein [Jiella marina]|uniref:ATP-binding protein n=1 Tax=Jiella sp. LLJ827 TaxID=2917712 RepID=UPI002101034E|nr:ATP-binding protein [Jiella sp. LLJ827]MCQ0988189.1 ATP-binding protein [Jiella sp. LLJ827]